ncbi:MAG: peptide chain release factor 3 [bacterium]|nr:peptide chain release factor 3 [bacterium]
MTEGILKLSQIEAETAARRTFAIISHPDAGKTTLTEKLLLYAGMIHTAGMVRARKHGRQVSSDWMSMERERGISITASAMQFRYKEVVINVLDTPGHQDFSEDTYRTLTAADSAVMVIDAAKGIETQTKKLFAVCRLRNTPILTFVNKMDMPGLDPFDLMSELETVLGISTSPINWPVGSGRDFLGVANLADKTITLFKEAVDGGAHKATAITLSFEEAVKSGELPEDRYEKLKYEISLLNEAGTPFSKERFLKGEITPVFFGSALTNFGVEPFFDKFSEIAPAPGPRVADKEDGSGEILIDPVKNKFSGYVFKIQANMDPRHRDSMAFIRICSGQFERDLVIKHHRLKKELRLSRSHSMFGGERSTIDLAFPGDIVGVVNPGVFSIGDVVSLEGGFNFKPMPKFSPEVIARIRPADVMRKKAFDKGMEQLSSEGAVLLLKPRGLISNDCLVAAVGKLQFEVLQHRLSEEYNVETKLEILPYQHGAWLFGDPDRFKPPSTSMMAMDLSGRTILLYGQEWEKRYALENNPGYELKDFIE